MPNLKRDPLTIGAVIAVCAVTITLATIQLARFSEFAALRNLAVRIETDQQVSRESLDRTVPRALVVMEQGVCQSEFITAALTVVLARLDQQNQDADYEAWSTAVTQAERVAGYALTCSPTNGNFWLRFAMVRQAISEQPEQIAHLVTFSQLYAPVEENVIAARFRLYNRLTQNTLRLLSSPLQSDLRIICQPQQAAFRKRLPTPGPLILPELKELDPNCSIGTALVLKSGR